MTTMAYHHESRQVAVDGRCTSGGMINSDNITKVHKVGVFTFILAGKLSCIESFIAEYPNIVSDIDCGGFCIEGDDIYAVHYDEGALHKSRLAYNDADGSGRDFALAAMDYGATAREAIKYAMTRDAFTGGKITVIKLPKQKVG